VQVDSALQMRLGQPTVWLVNLSIMSLTDHLHLSSDSIRVFLDERLVDFSPAKEKWHAAESGGVLADADASSSWSLVGWAIDYRIRMMLAPVRVQDSSAWRLYTYINDTFGTTLPSVASELEAIQERHGGTLGKLPAEEETHLLQICYVMAMYESLASCFGVRHPDSPLRTLRKGAKWQAHSNRVSEPDVDILRTLVEPALELFSLAVGQRVSIGPVFSDSNLVDGADGDLIVNGSLIEIKCEAPGFQSKAVRQAIAYCLLDVTGEYKLKRCSIYLARFGAMASWDLDQIIREISQGRYGYDLLRDEFHTWLVAQEEARQRNREALAESKRRFPEQWQALWDAENEHTQARYYGDWQSEEYRVIFEKLVETGRELQRLEAEAGLDIHRK